MVRMVSLSEEAYGLLTLHKKKDMSYSEVIIGGFRREKKRKKKADLLKFIDSLPKTGKKDNLSQRIDEVVYGARRA